MFYLDKIKQLTPQFRADPDNAPAIGWDCICLSFEKAGKQGVKGRRLQRTKEGKKVANRSHCSQQLSSCKTSKLFQKHNLASTCSMTKLLFMQSSSNGT